MLPLWPRYEKRGEERRGRGGEKRRRGRRGNRGREGERGGEREREVEMVMC